MEVWQAALVGLFELCLILVIYNSFIIPAIERRVIDKWLDEVNSGALNLPKILGSVTDDAAKKVMQQLKGTLLAGTGNLAKVLSNPEGDPQMMALKWGDGFLKDLGLKNPSALMIYKLLRSVNATAPVSEGVSEAPVDFRTGPDIFGP